MNECAPSDRRRLAVLAAVCMAALVLPLSFSAGAVATPAIGRALGGGAAALTWITNAFMLSFGSCLMAAGGLADRFGRRRVFLGGVSSFVCLSVGASLAPGIVMLDLLRAAQGVAAAAALAGGSAALAQEYDGPARLRAFSLLGTTFGIGLAVGPIVAGALTGAFGWRAVFLSPAVVGGVAAVLGGMFLQESRDPDATGFDRAGAAIFTAMLTLFTFGIIQGPTLGWSDPHVILLLAGSAGALIAFVVVERGCARPMLDLRLFGHARFVGVLLLPVATCYCYVVLLVLLPLRFIGIGGRSELAAGVIMLALSAPMLVVPFAAALISRRVSPGLLSGAGLLIAAAGLILLARAGAGDATGAFVVPLLMIGAGTGFPWGLMDGLSVSVVPKERAGMAAGIFSTMRVAGEGVALAVVTAILSTLMQGQLAGLYPDIAPDQRTAAALRLVTGDAGPVLRLAGAQGRAALDAGYGLAFANLLYGLAGVTAVTALVIVALFRKPGR